MDTTQIQPICLCALGIALLYFLLYFFVLRFARAELSRAGASRDQNAIRIYAKAESLEYYLRLAIAASSSDHLTIIVNIPKYDEAQT